MSWFCIVCFWCGEGVMTITFCACVFWESGGWLLLQKLNHITIARETRWTIVTLQIETINHNSFHLGRNFLTVIHRLTSATVTYRPQNWRIYTSESLKYCSKHASEEGRTHVLITFSPQNTTKWLDFSARQLQLTSCTTGHNLGFAQTPTWPLFFF